MKKLMNIVSAAVLCPLTRQTAAAQGASARACAGGGKSDGAGCKLANAGERGEEFQRSGRLFELKELAGCKILDQGEVSSKKVEAWQGFKR